MKLSEYVKEQRIIQNLTQVELSDRSGVGLRFVRDLEQAQIYMYDKLAGVLAESDNS